MFGNDSGKLRDPYCSGHAAVALNRAAQTLKGYQPVLDVIQQTVERHRMLTNGDHVIVGVSGGADSVTLLHGLLTLRGQWDITLTAAHVNHQLRGADADADAQFVRELCEQLGLCCLIFTVDVPKQAQDNGLSLEEAGRQLRYRCLEDARITKNAQKIACAHNRDDNAETVLMQLCRGSGLKGLCGIPPKRGVIIRPLIDIPRCDIEAYLQENGLTYRTDASNFDHQFLRNRVRHAVMPLLNGQINEQASGNIVRAAALLREDEKYLEETAQTAYESCSQEADCVINLDIVALSALPTALKRRVIRIGLARLTQLAGLAEPTLGTQNEIVGSTNADQWAMRDIGAKAVEQVLTLLEGEPGKTAMLPRRFRAQKSCGQLRLYLEPSEKPIFEPTPGQPLRPGQPVTLLGIRVSLSLTDPGPDTKERYTKIFNYDKIATFLELRTRKPGDRIYFKGVGSRKLQDYFIDRKIPRSQRDAIPLLADGEQILWIMDSAHRVNDRYQMKVECTPVWVTVEVIPYRRTNKTRGCYTEALKKEASS